MTDWASASDFYRGFHGLPPKYFANHFKGKIVMNKYFIDYEDPKNWDSYEAYLKYLAYRKR